MAASLRTEIVDAVRTWADSAGSPLPDELKKHGPNAPWGSLLKRVGDIAGENPPPPPVKLPLLDAGPSTTTEQAGWTWTASAKSDASLEIGIVHVDDLSGLGIEPAAGHQVISYAAALDLTAGLGAGGAVGAWGQASANLSAGTRSRIRWYVQAADTDHLLEAAEAAARYWRLPSDLDGMLSMASDAMFQGLVLDLQGSLDVAFQAGVQAPWTGWGVRVADGTAQVGLNVGLRAHAQLRVAGHMTFHVRPEDRHGLRGLRAELHVQQDRDAQGGLTFDAGLDLSGVVASAQGALLAAWPAPDARWLTALTQPGTAIEQELGAIIKANVTDQTLQQLALLALGQGSATDAGSTLLSRASRALADAIDGALADVAGGTARAQDITSTWLEGLLGSGADADLIEGKLTQAAAAALARASTGLTAKLHDLESRIDAAAQGKLEDVLAPLGAFGAKLRSTLDGSNGNKTSQAIASAIADYAKARRSLVDALCAAHKAKLALAISEQVQLSRGGTLAFAGWFSPQGDRAGAQRLYQALCAGRVRMLGDLVQAATDGHAFELDEGWLSKSMQRTETQSATLSLFGADFSSSRVNLIGMAFQTDLWGRMTGGTATAAVDAKSTDFWIGREVTLALQADVNATPQGLAVGIGLEGAFTTTGRRTSQAFAQNVVDAYARSMGARNRIDLGALMGAPKAPADQVSNFWRGFTLALPITIDAQGWRAFMDQPEDGVARTFLFWGLRCLESHYARTRPFDFAPPDEVIRDRAKTFAGSDDAARMLAWFGSFRDVLVTSIQPDAAYGNSVGFQFDVSTDAKTSREFEQFLVLHRFAGVLRAARALWRAGPQLQAAIGDRSQPQTPDALMTRVQPVLAQACAALGPVAVANQSLTRVGSDLVDEGVSWPFNTFALAMAQLTGRTPPPGFPLTASAAGAKSATPLLIG